VSKKSFGGSKQNKDDREDVDEIIILVDDAG